MEREPVSGVVKLRRVKEFGALAIAFSNVAVPGPAMNSPAMAIPKSHHWSMSGGYGAHTVRRYGNGLKSAADQSKNATEAPSHLNGPFGRPTNCAVAGAPGAPDVYVNGVSANSVSIVKSSKNGIGSDGPGAPLPGLNPSALTGKPG